jgi:hypothetical protein
MMTGGDFRARHFIRAIHRTASADDVDASHDGWHGFTPFFYFVALATVAVATFYGISIPLFFAFVKEWA